MTVLPGSYLARECAASIRARRIRMALVAETAECDEAAQRIVQFVSKAEVFLINPRPSIHDHNNCKHIIDTAWEDRASLSPKRRPQGSG